MTKHYARHYDACVKLAKETLKKGYSYQLYYNKGNPNNKRFHVRGFIDDQVCHCVWNKRWKTFRYGVDSLYSIGISIQDGHIRRPKKSPKEWK